MSRKPVAGLALAAALLLTGVSAPGAFADDLRVAVPYGDLDLTQTSGINRLAHRLNDAAEAVCPSYPGGSINISTKARACRREAVRKALADIGSADLAARFDPIRAELLASR